MIDFSNFVLFFFRNKFDRQTNLIFFGFLIYIHEKHYNRVQSGNSDSNRQDIKYTDNICHFEWYDINRFWVILFVFNSYQKVFIHCYLVSTVVFSWKFFNFILIWFHSLSLNYFDFHFILIVALFWHSTETQNAFFQWYLPNKRLHPFSLSTIAHIVLSIFLALEDVKFLHSIHLNICNLQ